MKKIYSVLAINKKTGEVHTSETVISRGSRQALLKAFGIEAEDLYISMEEKGSYEEDCPIRAVIEKPSK